MRIIFPLLLCALSLLPFKELPAQQTKVELVPYREVYAGNQPFDTLCPNGMYLQNLVSRDTNDHNLYLAFGNKTRRKIHCVEEGLNLPRCARPVFAYATDRTVAMFSSCTSSHGILLMTLEGDGVRVDHYTPLYINVIDSILLLKDDLAGKDKFLVSNLDNDPEKRQDVFLAMMIDDVINHKQKAFACKIITDCFEDIHYEKGTLSVSFSTVTLENSKPETLTKQVKVKWK